MLAMEHILTSVTGRHQILLVAELFSTAGKNTKNYSTEISSRVLCVLRGLSGGP